MKAAVVIPRTPFEGPLWRCGHPKTQENSLLHGGQRPFGCCRFCARVRSMNGSALKSERQRLVRSLRAEELLTIGERIVRGLI